jgi:hypothetical protein
MLRSIYRVCVKASAKLFGCIVQNHGYIKIMIQNSRFLKNMLFFQKKKIKPFYFSNSIIFFKNLIIRAE